MSNPVQVSTYEDLSPPWRDLHDSLTPLCDGYQIAQKSGIIARGTIANRKSQGRGIPGAIRAGKRVVYPRLEAVKWLISFTQGA